jgi:hypothetical protein
MKEKLLILMCTVQQRYYSLMRSKIYSDERGFGMNELLGIAAAVIIAGFVVVPGLREFSGKLMQNLNYWWDYHVYHKIFYVS